MGPVAAARHQVCLGHQVRNLTYAVEADGPDGRTWASDPRHVFGRAIRLHHERGHASPATFARRRTSIEKATDRLVFGPPLAPNSQARRLQKRYQQHRATWGAEASAIFTTLLTTARQRGTNLLDTLRAVAGPSPLQVAGMSS